MAKELFKKPKWLKPEINEGIYWIHIAIIIAVIYALMKYVYEPNQLTGMLMFVVYALYFAAGDVVAHTVLKLD